MILAEPPPSQGDLHFSLLRVSGANPSPVLAVGTIAGLFSAKIRSLSPLGLWPWCSAFSCTNWATRQSCKPMDLRIDRLVFLRRPGDSASRPVRCPPSRPVGRNADCLRRPGLGLSSGGSFGLGIILPGRLSGHDFRPFVARCRAPGVYSQSLPARLPDLRF